MFAVDPLHAAPFCSLHREFEQRPVVQSLFCEQLPFWATMHFPPEQVPLVHSAPLEQPAPIGFVNVTASCGLALFCAEPKPTADKFVASSPIITHPWFATPRFTHESTSAARFANVTVPPNTELAMLIDELAVPECGTPAVQLTQGFAAAQPHSGSNVSPAAGAAP